MTRNRMGIAARVAVSTAVSLAVAAFAPTMVATPAEAQQVTSQTGNTWARRVKPPKPGEKRITVQVAPRANPAVPPLPVTSGTAEGAVPVSAASGTTPRTPAAAAARYAWFWEQVSPALDDSGPGRLSPALASLGKGPGGARVAAPRLQEIQDIAAAHGIDLLRETVGTQVSPALALAVIYVESGGRVDALSKVGAQGLMQLMPATAERFGVSEALNAQQNIRGGVKFLDFLMEKFDGDPMLVLAGYNAGENSIAANGGVPDYAETRDYVPKVLAAFEVARGLCLTPPELLSDGCVFRVSQ